MSTRCRWGDRTIRRILKRRWDLRKYVVLLDVGYVMWDLYRSKLRLTQRQEDVWAYDGDVEEDGKVILKSFYQDRLCSREWVQTTRPRIGLRLCAGHTHRRLPLRH